MSESPITMAFWGYSELILHHGATTKKCAAAPCLYVGTLLSYDVEIGLNSRENLSKRRLYLKKRRLYFFVKCLYLKKRWL